MFYFSPFKFLFKCTFSFKGHIAVVNVYDMWCDLSIYVSMYQVYWHIYHQRHMLFCYCLEHSKSSVLAIRKYTLVCCHL